MKHMFISGLVSLAITAAAAVAQSTIDPAEPFAYGANAGWINFRPSAAAGVVVGETFLSGYAYGVNFGWVHLGDGTPVNGHSYGNTSGTDFGVNRELLGDLSGLAYGANIGWINFDWPTDPNDPNRPRFDPCSGEFYGYAWSANFGWIRLGTTVLCTASVAQPDSDSDSIPDSLECVYFGGLGIAGVGTDFDGDGQSDAAEAVAGTDPTDRESLLRIVSHTYANGFTQVTITFTSTPARLYLIERKAALTDPWIDSGLGLFTPDPGAETTRTFSFPGSAAQFFHVVAVHPLAP